MSVSATTITASSIGNADVGTATTGDNSTKIGSANFLYNTFVALNYVFNYAYSVTITGIKTFTSGLPLTSGTNPLTPITLGASRASILDILPASTTIQNISLMGQQQFLSSNFGTGSAGNVFRNPIVVRKTVDGLGVDNTKNKIICGTVGANSAGAIVTFVTPFTAIPLVFLTSQTASAVNVNAFDVSATGFKAYSASNATSVWFAIGR